MLEHIVRNVGQVEHEHDHIRLLLSNPLTPVRYHMPLRLLVKPFLLRQAIMYDNLPVVDEAADVVEVHRVVGVE